MTLGNNTVTVLKGTIIDNGTIAQNSSGFNTDIQLTSNLTLSGKGVLALSNNSNNRIYAASGTDTLTNGVNHTIQGSGQLGINNSGFGFTFVNNGNVIANQSTTLNIAPTGNTTNNGTFQANGGSTLFMNGTLTNYNPTTSTLTGGTYNAFSGTIALSQANVGSGAVIATNAATILLDGANSLISDASGKDIVRGHIAANTAAGNLTIQNGANLTTTAAANFTNAGTVHIGGSSTFTVGGTNDYVQSGGLTSLDKTSSTLLVAMGHTVRIDGGTLQGFGTVNGNLTNGGIVHPGDGPGILTVKGNYVQTTAGHFAVDILGASAGSGFSQLDLSGTATLSGTLDISLLNGFVPLDGETFAVLNSGGLSGVFTTVNGSSQNGVTFDVLYNPTSNPNAVVLLAHVRSVPEPASLAMMGIGSIWAAAWTRRRRNRAGT